MNLSGNAVRYWLQHENIDIANMIVAVDDLALPFGTIRIRPGGSDAGHNGLKNIAEMIGTQQFARLRFGIGNDFPRGCQIDYVLGHFPPEQLAEMGPHIKEAVEVLKTFCLQGLDRCMNLYNKRGNGKV